MPSVGALTVSIVAQTSQLRADLDKAKRSIAALEQDTRRSSDSMRSAFDKLGIGGETLKRSFGQVATGVLMMTGAFDKAGEAGKVLEQTLGAFMVGGPVGAGVALVSGAFKMLADEMKDSGEAASAAARAYTKALSDIDAKVQSVSERLQQVRDEGRLLELRSLGLNVPGGSIVAEREAGRLRELALREQERIDTMQRLLQMQREYDALSARRDAVDRNSFGGAGELASIDRAMREMSDRIFRVQKVNGLPVGGIDEAAYQKSIEQIDALNRKRLEAAQLLEDESDQLTKNANLAAEFRDAVEESKHEVVGVRDASDGVADAWREAAEAADAAHRALMAWIEEARDLDALSDKQVENAEALVRKYQAQRDIAAATTDEERDRLEVVAELNRLLDSETIGADQATAVFDAMMGARDAQRAERLRAQLESEARKAGGAAGAAGGEAFAREFSTTVETAVDPLLSDLADTLRSGVADALYDGVVNGFRNGAEIGAAIVQTLLRQSINALVGSLFSGLSGVLGGGGGGGVLGLVGGLVGGGGGLGGTVNSVTGGIGGLIGSGFC